MNKSIWLVVVVALFVVGCGKKENVEKKYEGVAMKKDYVSEGIKFLAQKNINRAVQSFDEAVKQDPNNVGTLLTVAEIFLRLNNTVGATTLLERAVSLDPENGEVYYLLAVSKGMGGQKEEAVNYAQRSVEIFMKNKDEIHFKRSLALLRGMTEAKAGEEATTEAK